MINYISGSAFRIIRILNLLSMKNIVFILFLVITLLSCNSQLSETADTVYTNGRIYTVNDSQPWAEAVALKDGKFLKVGSNEEVNSLQDEKTVVIDLEGKFVMPGIVDMHAHPFTGVDLGIGGISLTTPDNKEAIIEDIKTYIHAHPNKDMILGGNWNIGGIFENDSPDKKLLDEFAPDVPIFLLSQSGHSAWVNSKALELAGVDASLKNEGSYIFDRYPGTNEPSGTVREMGMVKIMSSLHYLSPEEFAPFLEMELERYSKNGITAIQPAEGSPSWLLGAALLEKEGRMNVRLFPALDWLTSQLRVLDDDRTSAFINDWQTYETELIKPHYVKIFADGAADSHTLLLSEVYADAPDTYGSMYLPFDDYRSAILDYHSRDISVHVHALGDSTATRIIDIFEEAEKLYPDSKGVLHLGHASFVREKDLDRIKNLTRVTMNFSPMLAIPHPQMDLFLKTPLGEDRYQQQYPVKTALDKGLTVGFGSDFPSSLVPDPESFFYMQEWITREVPEQPELGAMNKANAISVAEAVRGFTLGGAEALGYDYNNVFGSIEVGKSADMIILNQNLFEIPQHDIFRTLVLKTIFRGQLVFDRQAALEELEVKKIQITNKALDNAIDAAELNLLVEDDWGGGHQCFSHDREVKPGAKMAPAEINDAFAILSEKGYEYVRPARTVYWKNTDSVYWIQWTTKEDVVTLWAFDPELEKVVEVLQVNEK